ncbi:MAG TPA: DUF1549 domain-containing protein [Pirellulales bacterium]|nr:DUF1549 domain-containing protein [Pirellulales bacterium]
MDRRTRTAGSEVAGGRSEGEVQIASHRLALLAAAIWIVVATSLGAAEREAPARPDASPGGEGSFVERRRERFKQLPAPPAPPAVELPKAKTTSLGAIDRFVYGAWQAADLPEVNKPPDLCDDATFCRRVYLDLVGLIPGPLELNRFLADRSPQRREKLIDQLLSREADYAAHWTPFWEDALASQPVLSQGGVPTRGNYREWIYGCLEENRAYDLMVAELIDPTMPRRHGAVTEDLFGVKYTIEYVRNEDHTATLQTAANVGQVFLGTSMKCASCHDHFDNPEWTQQRFLGFASLFAPADLELVRCDTRLGKTVPARFPFTLPEVAESVPDELDARLHFAAQLLTDPLNSRFTQTIVNRLWRRYLGLGLIEPADDFRADHPPSHPELLEWLAYDFVEHGCDLKHTIRLILTSRTYQHRYDSALEDHFDSADRDAPRYFRSPKLRRLTGEQLLDSARVALNGKIGPDERCYLDARATALMRALGRPDSRNEISTSRPDDFGVVSALELLNGGEIHELIDDAPLPLKPALRQDPRRLADQLYVSVLSRHATTDEKKRIGQELGNGSSLEDSTRDLLWALICSPEFQYIK